MKRFVFVLMACMAIIAVSAQEFTQHTNNTVDQEGRRQGKWKTFDKDGNLKFTGQFRDGIPYGEFRYYFPSGKMKAVSNISLDGKVSYTKTYYQNGKLMAEGKFIDKEKDSTWSYYSEYDNVLLSKENYINGKRHGTCYNYFPDGAISEEKTYVNGVVEGAWNQYFPNGRLKLKSNYKNDKKQGLFMVYYPNGMVHISGMYVNSLKQGKWMYFNDTGEHYLEEDYNIGHLVSSIEYETVNDQ